MIKQKKILFVFSILAILVLTGWGCQKPTETTGSTGTGTGEPAGGEPTVGESLAGILGKGKELDNFSYDQIITMPGESSEAKIWKRGQKMRYETETEGKTTVMYMDLESGQIYIYDPATKAAIAMTSGVEEEQKPVDEVLDQVNPETKIIGRETIDGHKTVIVETLVEGMQEKIWFSEEFGLPLKMETKTADGTTTTEIKNLRVGSVSDADVTLPPDAQIMQLPNFPGFGTE